MTNTKTLTIVIPAMNERDAIQKVIQAVPIQELNKIGYETDILVIDSSTDETAELAEKAGASVVREPRRGYGRAYKTGFENARGDIIATIDADMTYPVEQLPGFVELLNKENIDFLNTNRFGYLDERSMHLSHKLGNKVLNWTTMLLFGFKTADSQSGMWVFRRKIWEQAVLRSDSMAFSEELKIEAGYFLKARWKEVPIQYRMRIGKAKLNTWRHGMDNLIFLIRKRIKR